MINFRPLTQTKFGENEGNCFAACIASLFPVEIEDVPDFYTEYGDAWYGQFQLWMAERFNVEPAMFEGDVVVQTPGVHYLIGGMSERGIRHSVIGLDGAMVWDPHPSRTGVIAVEDTTYFFTLGGLRG